MESSGNFLTNQLKANNKEAYDFIFRSYYMELYYLALKYTLHVDDAKDLTQATFIKFWESRAKLMADKPVKPLLFIIHRNNCLDYLKFKNNHKQSLLNDSVVAHDSDTPFDKIVSSELEFKIIETISELPPKCKEIFELSRFNGLKYAEIAQKLNISVKTVESQMGLAIKKLRGALVDYLPLLFILFFH